MWKLGLRHVIPFMGIHKWNFRYSVGRQYISLLQGFSASPSKLSSLVYGRQARSHARLMPTVYHCTLSLIPTHGMCCVSRREGKGLFIFHGVLRVRINPLTVLYTVYGSQGVKGLLVKWLRPFSRVTSDTEKYSMYRQEE